MCVCVCMNIECVCVRVFMCVGERVNVCLGDEMGCNCTTQHTCTKVGGGWEGRTCSYRFLEAHRAGYFSMAVLPH